MTLADEARAINKEQSVDVTALWEQVRERVLAAARKDRTSLIDPFIGLKLKGSELTFGPSAVQIEKLEQLCRNEGLRVVHHPDPDPGHPGSRPYTELFW